MIKLNQTYYKSLSGIFFTKNYDKTLFLQSLKDYTITNYNTKKVDKKYDADAIKKISQTLKDASAFYFSSGNLIFYLKNGIVYITKQGIAYTNDIAQTLKVDADAIKYDADFDAIYKRKTKSKSKTNDADANADALQKLVKTNDADADADAE